MENKFLVLIFNRCQLVSLIFLSFSFYEKTHNFIKMKINSIHHEPMLTQ